MKEEGEEEGNNKTLLHPFDSLLGWPRLLSLGYKANDMWITHFVKESIIRKMQLVWHKIKRSLYLVFVSRHYDVF